MSVFPFIKVADLVLQPHQERLRNKVKKQLDTQGQARMLAYHGLGSGKTISSIAAADAAGAPFTAVVPAALRENYNKDLDFAAPQQPANVISYEQLLKGPIENDQTLVVDEIQRARNLDSARGKAIQDAANRAKTVILLSGTPVVNSPADLAAPISALTGKPITAEQFNERYVDETGTEGQGFLSRLFKSKPDWPTLKNTDELELMLQGKVDYQGSPEGSAEVTNKTIPVTMSRDQANLYRGMYEKLPLLTRWKLERDYPLNHKELQRLTGFLTGPRQVGLSTLPFMKGRANALKAFDNSPKLMKAMESLKTTLKDNPEAKALIFSNFIDAGLKPYQAALDRAGIRASIFSGNLNDIQRKQIIEDYNAGRNRVALIGPAGSEGLSTKGTRLVQLLDPHWHESRSRQNVGRAVRFDSHQHLDPTDRNVTVEQYRAMLPRSFKDFLLRRHPEGRPAADTYLEQIAKHKDHLNQQALDLLKRVGSSPE